MALTLAERDALTTNEAFMARTRAALGKQAQFYIDTSAPQKQLDWAANILWAGNRLVPVSVNIMPQLVNTGTIIEATAPDASDIADDALQGAVGTICDNYS